MSNDLLDMEHINGLPQPFMANLGGMLGNWPVYDIDVESGLVRIDACGKLDVKHISDVLHFLDADGNQHETESFYAAGDSSRNA